MKPGGPAAAAGLQIQDIILTADDRRVETLPSLSAALYLHRLDQVVKLKSGSKRNLYVPAIEQHDLHGHELLNTVDPKTF